MEEERYEYKGDSLLNKLVELLLVAIIMFISSYILESRIALTNISFVRRSLILFIIIRFISLSFLQKLSIEDFNNIVLKDRLINISIILLIFVSVGSALTSNLAFNAKKYSKLIEVEDTDEKAFDEDIQEADIDTIAIYDDVLSYNIARRNIGKLGSKASEFDIKDLEGHFTQINYKDRPVRVAPFSHSSLISYINNKGQVPGYVIIDSVTGDTEVKMTDQPIKYTKDALFLKDIDKYIWKNYMTETLDEARFEIDEEGNPYWISTVYDRKIGVKGYVPRMIVAVNAITGEIDEYKIGEIPEWVDIVFNPRNTLKYVDYHEIYKNNGYLKAKFTKLGIRFTSDGYGYLVSNSDVYIYSGITSGNTNSNIGFTLINARTGEAKIYNIPIADESTVRDALTNNYVEKEYIATFPILAKVNGRPTYIVSLKHDDENTDNIALYVMLDGQNTQVRSIDTSLNKTIRGYREIVGDGKDIDEKVIETDGSQEEAGIEEEEEDLELVEVVIEEIDDVVIDGNSYIIIKDGKGTIYKIAFEEDPSLLFKAKGDRVEIKNRIIN